MSHLADQIAFVLEIDKLKAIERRSRPVGMVRQENSAEHSWHVATMAMMLAEHGAASVKIDHVIRLLLVHDVVEIDADDTFLYDVAANVGKAAKELAAAERIFGLLPPVQRNGLMALWREYEDCETPEARFAYAMDRAIPMMLNLSNGGASWRENHVRYSQVIAKNQQAIMSAAPALWAWLAPRLADAKAAGWFAVE